MAGLDILAPGGSAGGTNGIQSSVCASGNSNPAGMTPTIRHPVPSIVSSRPMTFGLPLKYRCQAG